MDIGLYRDEEQFATFDSSSFLSNYPDDSSVDDIHGYSKNDLFECLDDLTASKNDFFEWNNENERELNGDMAVIPGSESSYENINNLSSSPPTKELHKLLGWQSWQSFLNLSGEDFSVVDSGFPPEEEQVIIEQKQSNFQEILDLPDFNLVDHIASEPDVDDENIASNSVSETTSEHTIKNENVPVVPIRKLRPACKKIDLQGQKYIIENEQAQAKTEVAADDDCDVDVETVSEGRDSPVLEAGDLTTLLEQFEATELPQNIIEDSISKESNMKYDTTLKVKTDECPSKNNDLVLKTNGTSGIAANKPNVDNKNTTGILKTEKVVLSNKVKILEEQINNKKDNESNVRPNETSKSKSETEQTQNTKTPESTTSLQTPENTNNKRQILNSLPQELIARIKESGKRKPITVIPPIPNKKRQRTQEIETPLKLSKKVNSDSVQLDHNYCSSPSQNYKKDSGFESSEDDERAIINKQPTVKNVDGKLMVSLLKVNTIRTQENNQKKKLNLEEYKKRRKCVLASNGSSQNSPSTSSCSSPLPEDENLKLLRHQEKLRKMAEEVLNTTPKSEKKPDTQSSPTNMQCTLAPLTPASTQNSSLPETPLVCPESSPVIKAPPHLETKILVSFGVNTDFVIAKDEDPLAPVEKLQEIKPLLEKVSSKINENSLITSLIENIPKVINKNEEKITNLENKQQTNESTFEHGENKQVLHLEKDRVRTETVSVGTQTSISLIDQSRRGRVRRRRVSSSSSCSSSSSTNTHNTRSRKDSACSSSSTASSRSSCSRSSSSRSSNYSQRLSYSRSCSRSRSRSRSPRYQRKRRSPDRDHLSAVEERRIIYVGRILTGTTKEDLRRKFQKFGPITNVSLHFRDHGENYGFVTFKYKEDAHDAYEHGNDDESFPFYKISFGGRREFCKTSYSDLDNVRDEPGYFNAKGGEDSFDALLRQAQEKLRKRKA